jgi:very-short-patch-repair endonuclease
VVSRSELLRAGVSTHHVEHRLATGRLVRMHRGVYRVGGLEAPRARHMAAILACGENAVISHESSAGMLGLTPTASSGAIDVGLSSGYRRRPGLRIHRLPTLRRVDVMRIERIPLTTAARTLWDLATTSAPHDLARLYAKALDRGLVRRAEMERLRARHAGAPGSGIIRRLLENDPVLTRSPAEDRLQELIRAAGLPQPRTNVVVMGLEVDCYWPGHGVVVEVDGFAYHGSAAAFERDRARDRRLVASGLVVLRVTWRQLDETPMAVVAQLAQALARSPASA